MLPFFDHHFINLIYDLNGSGVLAPYSISCILFS